MKGKTMKTKLIALIALAILTLSPKAHAIGGCVAFWQPYLSFFYAGGRVTVSHPDGSTYSVTGANVIPGGAYSLDQGDNVYIAPPTCALYNWGYTYFCPCNNQGGVTCGNPQLQQAGSTSLLHLSVFEDCQCPNGGSSFSLLFVYRTPCQAPPPPGQ
jgi:hypothetical protein